MQRSRILCRPYIIPSLYHLLGVTHVPANYIDITSYIMYIQISVHVTTYDVYQYAFFNVHDYVMF